MAYRGPGLQYKIRKIVSKNETGDSFGITIPRIIAEKFSEVYLKISVSGNSILLTSGCKLSIKDIDEIKQQTSPGRIWVEGRPTR